MVHVTRPFLPPLDEFIVYLERIWKSGRLTNNGPLHRELEQALRGYLGVEHISLFANGTLALIAALKVLGLEGEVITTPFSFVATTHAIQLCGLQPVFADIDPETLDLDPAAVERAITPRTAAILPVHVYGRPCDTEGLGKAAASRGLKVVYDACHAFGVEVNGRSLLDSGDLAVLSFHATKVFNTCEGGAVVCHDPETKRRLDLFRNFGFVDEVTVASPGLNAKMNEIQAALGLLQLDYIDGAMAERAALADRYRAFLSGLPGLRLLDDIPGVRHNNCYFPVLVDGRTFGASRDGLYEKLKRNGVHGRRYFYPLISRFPPYDALGSARPGNLPAAEEAASRVLCLPIYPGLTEGEQDMIIELVGGL